MSKTPKNQPTVSIVGSGRLGTALAIALSASGYRVQAVVARHSDRARKAAARIGRGTEALTTRQLDQLPPSAIILITTPDDQIGPTATLLASKTHLNHGQAVLHTSGALSSEVLAPLSSTGVSLGSLHPLISVSDSQTGSKNLRGAFYCIEGDSKATKIARSLVRHLKGESFSIATRSKPLYHAAAVMASGHVVALFDLSAEMLMHCGLSAKTARRVLLPLLRSTVDNLSNTDPARALTGTFARGDLSTVRQHLLALSSHQLDAAREAYKILGAQSLELARHNSNDPEITMQIRRALSSAGRKSR